jgi:hypothetical protein
VLIWWSYITIHKVGNMWYTEILNYSTYSQFPLPALPLLLLPVSIKLISTHWEMIKHTIIPATYIELSLHKYRTGTKLVHLLKHFREKCKVRYISLWMSSLFLTSWIQSDCVTWRMPACTLHTKTVTTAEIHEKNIFYHHYNLRLNFCEGNLTVTTKLHKTVTERLTFLIIAIFVIWHLTCSV